MARQKTAYERLVDYSVMDPFKVEAQEAGKETARALRRSGYREVSWSRGESCYLMASKDGHIFGHVEEGLGTKNRVVELHRPLQPKGYAAIAQDTVAMITNDMATLGVQPLSVLMHCAVGSSTWFLDHESARALIQGWKDACLAIAASWGGGETPTLRDVVSPCSMVLSGSAFGEVIDPKRVMSPFKIRAGDAIILFASSGIHANGLTLAREIADAYQVGYDALISSIDELYSFKRYGEELVRPTVLYSPIIQCCLKAGIPLHYGVHISGHGWAKLMRSPKSLTYVIERVPGIPELFTFIQRMSARVNLNKEMMSDKEMYKTFNMGAGFAVYVAKRWTGRVIGIAAKHGIDAFEAGYVTESQRNDRRVKIKSKNIEFGPEDLKVR
ncbi:MAG: hypothetical protein A2847_00810 [Candidatus Sungbacteria bacterium RIFCSPHIGHO2_01_FULL_50_25]|uniref:Phosphoribosylformylglycinamidine cyclo-ligase n=1 Tax=Candidatus Sungbacteria bacterium RIFCSPHIGHO2_01_FULL_50_25 TaxID=1802265 RepID=A0A1G2KBQ2_9BACT|nr:MAG: hypothetical protein A2847_00810 [Candidatus Sungbacteria bacterium RIFCSPHIGHO2_01_FULL_50_25]